LPRKKCPSHKSFLKTCSIAKILLLLYKLLTASPSRKWRDEVKSKGAENKSGQKRRMVLAKHPQSDLPSNLCIKRLLSVTCSATITVLRPPTVYHFLFTKPSTNSLVLSVIIA